MTCTCSYEIALEATSCDEAVEKIKGMMTPDFIASHMAEKHPWEAVPGMEDMRKMVEEKVSEVA